MLSLLIFLVGDYAVDTHQGIGNAWKVIGLTLGIAGSLTFATPSYAENWYSNLEKTVVPNLDSICLGNRNLRSSRIGFGSASWRNIRFNDFKNHHCIPRAPLTSSFQVYQTYCKEGLTVIIGANNRGDLQWNITNLGSCTVDNDYSEIINYPFPITSNARVVAATSNVRVIPNGRIICSVNKETSITIYPSTNDGWYRTDVCGAMGQIHHSQIEF